MVGVTNIPNPSQLYELLSSVVDPEIPVLTLRDLGVLREISVDGGKITVTITPTYAGCPAIEAMRADIESKLAEAGFQQVTIKQSLNPAWTTDWMSESGRENSVPMVSRHPQVNLVARQQALSNARNAEAVM